MEEPRGVQSAENNGRLAEAQGRASSEALSESQAVELSSESDLVLIRNQNGLPKNKFINYTEILGHDLYLKGKLSFDTLAGRIMLEGFYWNAERHPLRDYDLSEIRKFISGQYELDNELCTLKAAEVIAHHNSYNPVEKLLDELPAWDGEERIKELFPRYLGAERSDYVAEVTKIILHGAICRIKSPGIKFDLCVILADVLQGTGKSTMCELLALDDKYFTDNLRNMDDLKSSYEVIRGHWIIELGEMLATRRAKDIESIKSYLSRRIDSYRSPYSKVSEDLPRQCVFIGTTNRDAFLPDDSTGNRRFLPVICDGKNAVKHPLEDVEETRAYIRQCYAEALELGKRDGWTLTLDHRFDAEVDAIRDAASPENTNIGLIQRYLDEPEIGDCVCSRMIWDAIYTNERLYSGRIPTRAELKEISEIMNLKITGWIRHVSKTGKPVRVKFDSYGMQLAWNRIPNPVPNRGESDTEPSFGEVSEDEDIPF